MYPENHVTQLTGTETELHELQSNLIASYDGILTTTTPTKHQPMRPSLTLLQQRTDYQKKPPIHTPPIHHHRTAIPRTPIQDDPKTQTLTLHTINNNTPTYNAKQRKTLHHRTTRKTAITQTTLTTSHTTLRELNVEIRDETWAAERRATITTQRYSLNTTCDTGGGKPGKSGICDMAREVTWGHSLERWQDGRDEGRGGSRGGSAGAE